MNLKRIFLIALCIIGIVFRYSDSGQLKEYGEWMSKPQSQWPQMSMVNEIEYTDKHHPIAGCGFLLDTGKDTLAVTAKHVLVYFKSESMNSVSFKNTLKTWKMYPKNNPDDVVIVDRLLNENTKEPIDRIPPQKDWLFFNVKERSLNIQPLRFRTTAYKISEPVYIIGWRYSDKDCPQVVYQGNFVEDQGGSILISTEKLTNNKMPGLSGSPVIDSKGNLIGLMSQKAGKMERLASIEYPMDFLKNPIIIEED